MIKKGIPEAQVVRHFLVDQGIYPVSYCALPAFSIYERSPGAFEIALREWIGIAIYWLTGRM